MDFEKWFKIFLEEKYLPFMNWEIVDGNGITHYISSDVVHEHILVASDNEQSKIKDTIINIDLKNGDVNHFFKHLATAIANIYGSNSFINRM